ncbi:MAG TPA: lipid-A-disaccharide synthase [Candidatus Competibacteraceae bacterium]|nr:lipid-A-disaccharide synthase [Candidatus Competibacteraceae bacterium]
MNQAAGAGYRPLFVLVAGELSGDILGGGLITALRRRFPQARFAGIGGPRMQAAGLESWYPLDTLSVMGLVEVLKHLPALLHLRRELLRRCLAERPAVFIGIDAPDFNLGLELRLRRAGLRTVHYVSPSVWAWRQGRVKTIARAVDLMLTLLPFEARFYEAHQVPVHFVGHPLADEIPLENDRDGARQRMGLGEGRWLALLPGSRGAEVERLAPLFLETARRLWQRFPDLGIIVPAATPFLYHHLLNLLSREYPDMPVTLLQGRAREAMAAADVVLLASGTATLECMLLGRPMVVAYRVAPVTAWLARRLVKLRHFALPNLLADRELVPEYIQEAATADNLEAALLPLLRGEARAPLDEYRRLHQSLRRNASERAAEAVCGLLG